ncbi:hypothetical protein QTQ03_18820 [Micromonospora sp. WMMA1363]|uniref:hypothetical protein n=1 Tax=Micromonospora sp. WMMA1363 TaxID=3053985 RepID=UPI00259D0457|nr:hypothetical protein [Micromonospora sp. WMMA1363]MDM4721543.1 hypothetical protein [Micromonospora sp. WMMA1363]
MSSPPKSWSSHSSSRAPVEQVRRRGRQRTRRTRAAAVLASAVAVAVVASGAVALAGRPDVAPVPLSTVDPTIPAPNPDPSPTGDPSPGRATPSSPAPTTGQAKQVIPAEAMLQLADLPLPSGWTMTREVDTDWTLEAEAAARCDNRPPWIMVDVVATATAQFDSPTHHLVERATGHSGDGAATSMQRLRQVIADCVPVRPVRSGAMTIMAEGLGGDESMLVGSGGDPMDAGSWDEAGPPRRMLIVRQGYLVAQLRLDFNATAADARYWAKKVAPRLCAGTDVC